MSEQSFSPHWISPPGETVADLMVSLGITTDELATHIGGTTKHAQKLLRGDQPINRTIAEGLASAVGSTASFWLRREHEYREELSRVLEDADEWLSELPVKEMVKFGWLPSVESKLDRITACLDFFDIPEPRAWHTRYDGLLEKIAYKTSQSFDSAPSAVAAWIRRAELEADEIDCGQWDKKAFSESLAAIRKLTRKKNPGEFIVELQSICAKSGVAVVVVRAPTGCRASGATKFLQSNKALILLSARYLSEDHFWFAFFHEAAHVLLHGNKAFFLEGTGELSSKYEEEANLYAEALLIPKELQETFLRLNARKFEIIRFARQIGISAGLVVGQLQHKGLIGHHQMNSLKRKFRWSE
jgi:HTH-type transcriptional regulator / antitoxin HigA